MRGLLTATNCKSRRNNFFHTRYWLDKSRNRYTCHVYRLGRIRLECTSASLQKCRQRNVQWRPHAKCHKSPAIAKRLIDAGAIGVTCAKLGEAEVMAAAGIRDLLIANMLVGQAKMRRLVDLRRIADPIVCVDHVEHVRSWAQAMTAAGLTLRVTDRSRHWA